MHVIHFVLNIILGPCTQRFAEEVALDAETTVVRDYAIMVVKIRSNSDQCLGVGSWVDLSSRRIHL